MFSWRDHLQQYLIGNIQKVVTMMSYMSISQELWKYLFFYEEFIHKFL